MARQPHRIQPFEPFASGRAKKGFPIVTDDRRNFVSKLSGISISNEATIVGQGAWPVMNANAPTDLVEALRLTLPRPEPVTLSFHPWEQSTARFRGAIKLYSHISAPASPVVESLQGRIIIEWGSGATREWTYVDMAPGSIQLPSCTHVKVSGWTHTATVNLGVSAQVGYAHGPHDAIWSMMLSHNVAWAYQVLCPHYAREISGNLYSSVVDAEGYLQAQNVFSPPVQYWLMRPAITPNPQDIPYAPVNVPLGGGYMITLGITNPGAVPAFATLIAMIKIRI